MNRDWEMAECEHQPHGWPQARRFVAARRFIVIDRRPLQGSVAEVGGRCQLCHQARIINIQDGQEKIYQLRYGAEPIHLPGPPEKLWLVVVAGFGEESLMLLTDLPAVARDSLCLWWIVQIYLTRWKIEETFRFVKQSYNLEGVRVMNYQRLKNLVTLVTWVGGLRNSGDTPGEKKA